MSENLVFSIDIPHGVWYNIDTTKGNTPKNERKKKMYTNMQLLYERTMEDLRNVGRKAKQTLREKNLAHIVYAYSTKEAPHEIHLLEWKPLEFKTDKEFNDYLKLAEPEAAMIYAVHA